MVSTKSRKEDAAQKCIVASQQEHSHPSRDLRAIGGASEISQSTTLYAVWLCVRTSLCWERTSWPPESNILVYQGVIVLSVKYVVVVQLLSCVNSLWPHGLQNARLLSFTISQSLLKLMSNELVMLSNYLILCCPLLLLASIFPTSGSFPMTSLFASGGQSIGVLTLASVLPMNIQSLFPLGQTGLISVQSKGLSRVFSSTIMQKHQFFSVQPSLWFNFHIRTWLLEKP